MTRHAVDWGRTSGAGFAECDGCDWDAHTSPAYDLKKVRDRAESHTAQTGHTTRVETITRWVFEAIR